MNAVLALEDGSVFKGLSAGVDGENVGEVVLDTAVVGYQEIMTDPANAGKIVVMTYPLIGNYGVAGKFNESRKCWIAGLVIKEKARMYSNWQAQGSFDEFLNDKKVIAVSDIDTRTLAITIRDKGEMLGIISTKTDSKDVLLKKLKKQKRSRRKDLIREISVGQVTQVVKGNHGPFIAVLDLGMTNSFIGQLKRLGCNVTLLPYNMGASDILSMRPDGLVISSGPEQDASIPKVVSMVRSLIGKVPMLGISAGHEAIGLALGAKLEKMKVGHRGVNYPVIGPGSYKGDITVQNHSYIIRNDSLKNKKGVKVTLRNLNDDSIEEMESRPLKFISTQYYPASPGFDEASDVFRRFLKMSCPNRKIKMKNNPASCGEVQYA